jgi:hypothetical protein
MPRKLNITFHALQLGILIFALVALPLAHDLHCAVASAQDLGEYAHSSDLDSEPAHGDEACSEAMSERTDAPDGADPNPKKETPACCVPSIAAEPDVCDPYGRVAKLAVKVSLPVPDVMRGIEHRPLEKPPRNID